MITNKIIIGLAKTDKTYGLDKTKQFVKISKSLLDTKINHLDTSPSYLNSSKFVANLNSQKKFKIYTKLPFIPFDENKSIEKKIIKNINFQLRYNKADCFEGVFLHDPTMPLNRKLWGATFKTLKKLKNDKIIKNIGVSVYNSFELKKILKVFTPDIVQFPINVLNQDFCDEDFLSELKRKKIKLFARSIFLQGAIFKKIYNKNKYFNLWKENFEKWFDFLNKNNINEVEASIKFLLSKKYIDYYIIGVNNINQLKNNIKLFKKISKSRQNRLNFKDLAVDDQLLTDPRFWKKEYKNLKMWNESKKFFPVGSMLLSKKPEQLLPGGWPTFYKKASGCEIWTNENKKYIDFSLMGVGTNILGYANKRINKKIFEITKNSNVSTLNSTHSFELAKILIKNHKWSKHCLFARTGAEANSIALRIARAKTGKDGVAICGYHGWHDWYLSSNLAKKDNLNKIHLSGLSTIGIPKKLKGLTYPFLYNDIQSFRVLIAKNKNIGTVFMEVRRNIEPKNNFLKKIKKICEQNNIVLIFDECTSGFRETFGGLHKKYNINPDIAVFGKAIGNGIPITSILMGDGYFNSAKSSFISSTFWSESLGPAAAIETLKEMKRIKSWKTITKIGKSIKRFWTKMSKKYGIKLEINGIDPMPSFQFTSLNNEYYKNFITQEFLKRNILSSNVIYCCVNHTRFLNKYFFEFEKIFKKIKQFESGKKSIFIENIYPLPNSNFQRLN